MSNLLDLPRYDPAHWQLDAVCFRLGVDPNVMQPEKATREEVAEAIAVCAGCPVLEDCRRHAEGQGSAVTVKGASAYGVHAGVWFGPDPVWEAVRTCGPCGKESRVRERHAVGEWFCSRGCRSSAAVSA